MGDADTGVTLGANAEFPGRDEQAAAIRTARQAAAPRREAFIVA
jgi:hypothetical protein